MPDENTTTPQPRVRRRRPPKPTVTNINIFALAPVSAPQTLPAVDAEPEEGEEVETTLVSSEWLERRSKRLDEFEQELRRRSGELDIREAELEQLSAEFEAEAFIRSEALEERAASLARRSIKRESKVFALDLAVRMMDLTTLEGADTPGKIAALCSKAMRPDPSDLTVPPVAAVCVYPNLVSRALERLGDSGVKVASVATAFPSAQSPLEIKVEEAALVAELGAHEIDMVIDRGAFLSGNYAKVYERVRR